LSRIPQLTVYPGEHFDFLVQQGKASYIDIAKQLGITKVIRVSFLVGDGNMLLIEAHLEDVEPPVQGLSEEVRGKQEEFLNLIQELTGKITKRLNLQLVEQPEVPSSASDAFKLMLEGEGEVLPVLPQQETPPPGLLRKPADRHSWIPSGEGWFETNEAWAEEAPPQGRTLEEEIRQALEKYRQAYEKRDLVMLEDVYEKFTTAQRQANTEYFQNTQNLRVTIRDVVISVSGDEAAVSYTREDEFIDAKTGQRVKLDARLTKIFVRQDGGWKITLGRK
jgi:ketosteroid isomerase-like protein